MSREKIIKNIISLHKKLENDEYYYKNNGKEIELPILEKVFPKVLNRIDLQINNKFRKNRNLYEILSQRKSCRDYNGYKISFEELSNIIYFSYGIKEYREMYGYLKYPILFSPSSGASNPFNLYIYIKGVENISEGLYCYSYKNNSLIEIHTNKIEKELNENYHIKFPISANINIFIVANIDRFVWKYGERGYRFVNVDCGILAENITLLSENLNLKSCMIAAFSEEKVRCNLKLNDDEIPLLAISIGL